jgi:hypothetical protein
MDQEEGNRLAQLAAIEANDRAAEIYDIFSSMTKEELDLATYCGPLEQDYMVLSKNFETMLARLASGTSKVGQAANYQGWRFDHGDRDLIIAEEKIKTAQKLLLGAEAILRAKLRHQLYGGPHTTN